MTGGNPRHLAAATELRAAAAALHQLPAPERIILGPGVLASINLVLHRRGVRRLLLARDDYFTPDVFDIDQVDAVAAGELERAAPHYDAVFVSLVNWSGHRLPLADLFGGLRRRAAGACPLLVADCSHAGADGFPDLATLGADLVCGDLAKWLLPPDRSPDPPLARLAAAVRGLFGGSRVTTEDKVTFVWPATPEEFGRLRRLFGGYYLAVEAEDKPRSGTFAPYGAVVRLAQAYRSPGTLLEELRRRHSANLALARRLAPDRHPETAIVVVPESALGQRGARLRRLGLAVTLPSGQVRVLARSDLWPS